MKKTYYLLLILAVSIITFCISLPIETKSVVHSRPIPYDDFCTIIKMFYDNRSKSELGNDYNDVFYDLQKYLNSIYDLEGYTEEDFIKSYQRHRKILYYAENQGYYINDEKYKFFDDIVVLNYDTEQKLANLVIKFAKPKNISPEEALKNYIIPFNRVESAARGVLLTYYQKNVYKGIFQKYSEEYDRLQKEAGDKGRTASDYYSTKEFQTAFVEFQKDFEVYVETLEYKE